MACRRIQQGPVIWEIIELTPGEVIALSFDPIVKVASGRSVFLWYLSLENLAPKRLRNHSGCRGALPIGQWGDFRAEADASFRRPAELEGSAYKLLRVLRERRLDPHGCVYSNIAMA
jgi:hypothetical protein